MGKYSRQPEPKRGPGLRTILLIVVAVVLVIGVVAGIFLIRNKLGAAPGRETEPAEELQGGEPAVEVILPKLYLDGNISGANQSGVPFRYLDGDEQTTGYASVSILEQSAQHDKKDYTIALFEDQACSQSMNVNMGWGEQSVYSLLGNWTDKTHARNIVTARLLGQMQKKYELFPNTPNRSATDGFAVEVYSGSEFLGLYTVNIPLEPWMMGMDPANPNHMAILSIQDDTASAFLESPIGETWNTVVGTDDFTSFSKIMSLYDFVTRSSDEEFKANFTQHFDLDAVLNYYILADVAYLTDNLSSNMLLVTYGGKTWYPVPYNMAASWGMNADGSKLLNYGEESVPFFNSYLFARIENCFSEELRARYTELRQDILSQEHILGEFEAFAATVSSGAFAMEQEKWGGNIPGQGMEQIEDYLQVRLAILDEKYDDWDGFLEDREKDATAYIRAMGIEESDILGSPVEPLARALGIFGLEPLEEGATE